MHWWSVLGEVSEAIGALLDFLFWCSPSKYCVGVQAELLGSLVQVVQSMKGNDSELELPSLAHVLYSRSTSESKL